MITKEDIRIIDRTSKEYEESIRIEYIQLMARNGSIVRKCIIFGTVVAARAFLMYLGSALGIMMVYRHHGMKTPESIFLMTLMAAVITGYICVRKQNGRLVRAKMAEARECKKRLLAHNRLMRYKRIMKEAEGSFGYSGIKDNSMFIRYNDGKRWREEKVSCRMRIRSGDISTMIFYDDHIEINLTRETNRMVYGMNPVIIHR